jgi:hypothetical protein
MFDASGAFQPGAWPAFAGLIAFSLLVAGVARAQVSSRRRIRRE